MNTMFRLLKPILLLSLCCQTQAFAVAPKVGSPRQKATARMAVANYASGAAALFNNMKTPASIIAGAMVPMGMLAPLKFDADKDDGRFAIFLRRVYPIVAVLSLCSELVSVMWATVAVNQLTETKLEAASSVWHLIQRDFSLPWVATNAHFVFGMIGFMWVIASRAYFFAKGPIGASAAGLAFSSLLLITSVVNRGVASGGGDGLRLGSSILALFRSYAVQLLARACSSHSFGPLELSAMALFAFSLGNGLRIVVRDVLKGNKSEA